MRVFIAVDFPENVKEYLFNLEKEIRKLPIKCNFVAKKNLHITLKFILSIRPNELELIKEKLKELKFPRFKLKLKGLDFFPNKDKARIIWIGIDNKNELLRLQKEMDYKILEVLNSDSQKFEAHITLGRIKLIKNKEKFIQEIDKIKIKDIEFEVNSFKLFESILTREGPIYKQLNEYHL